MKLNQPYYIEPRKGESHFDLNGEWEFGYAEETTDHPSEEMWIYKTKLPNSLYHSLSEAGVLPDPYVGTNSRLYSWVDEKIWYYRKHFNLSKPGFEGNAFLCFDGIAYYSRVWINGILLGDHEGMYGGPVCDVMKYLNLVGDNEIVVEVKACNYGKKESFDCFNKAGDNREIVPWNIARDNVTSNGDFIVIGIWNNVRIEFTDKLHISRPYIYTKSASEKKADLFLEFEIADGTINELQPFYGYDDDLNYTNATASGLTGSTREEAVEIHICIYDKSSGGIVYNAVDTVNLTDYDRLWMNKKYLELQYFSKDICVENPKLWYPVGLGEPFLYHVTIELYSYGRLCDCQELDFGIRTFASRRTAGNKYTNRWGDFLFSINGKDLFIKGINWMPVDFLYSVDPLEYEWCLSMAKNAGIQMLRIWSGGGMPETDTFYEICDRLGIMVWQDHMLANVINTRSYPQDILEAQEAYNIYRIRNHPSLVLHCGGNEHNPYNRNLAASMFIINRVVKALDPSRIFHYAAQDGGSAHVYTDMDPAWYRHAFKQLPFLDESGIHSFPSYKTLRRLISEKECTAILPDLSSEEFGRDFPELINHFTEYNPSRIPRMMARTSQIGDIRKMTLEDVCEASHVQAYEFYLHMVQGIRANYPVCGGIMPWTYRRPWATVGIQTVDGMGQPTYPYYAILQSYQPLNISLCLNWTVIAPAEEVPLQVRIFNQNSENLNGGQIKVTLYRPDLSVAKEYSCTIEDCRREYVFDSFYPGDEYTDCCFLICADLWRDGKLLSRSSYFVKCTSMLTDKELYQRHRSSQEKTLYFTQGPWLKDSVQNGNKAMISAKILDCGMRGNFHTYDLRIENTSDFIAYPVTAEVTNDSSRYYANDNFFMLKPGEIRELRLTCDGLAEKEEAEIVVKAWNANKVTFVI